MLCMSHPKIGSRRFEGNFRIMAQNEFKNSNCGNLKISSSMNFLKLNQFMKIMLKRSLILKRGLFCTRV